MLVEAVLLMPFGRIAGFKMKKDFKVRLVTHGF